MKDKSGICIGNGVNEALVLSLLSLQTQSSIISKLGGRVLRQSITSYGEYQCS